MGFADAHDRRTFRRTFQFTNALGELGEWADSRISELSEHIKVALNTTVPTCMVPTVTCNGPEKSC